MIISYRHGFIFVRTRKTASSTIERTLRKVLGPDDMFVSHKNLVKGSEEEIVDGLPTANIFGHMTLQEIRPLVSADFWQTAYKFTSERHPYEKAVSLAYYNYGRRDEKGRDTPEEFSEYLDKTVRRGSYRGFDHYTIGGKVAVDDFIRFERLDADMRRIGDRLGFAVPPELPQKKSAYRSDRRPAREILSQDQKSCVQEHCREEFELLGYEP